MRNFTRLASGLIVILLVFTAAGAVAKKPASKSAKKSPVAAKSSVARKSSATKKSSSSRRRAVSSKTSNSKRGSKGPVRRAAARPRQMAPTPERYKQIQAALAAKGYLPAEQVTGQWNDASAEAMKKFQADQNLDANGKVNSLSLIALGLGPKRDTTAAAKPPAPAASANP